MISPLHCQLLLAFPVHFPIWRDRNEMRKDSLGTLTVVVIDGSHVS
jgi:hypothetical protein